MRWPATNCYRRYIAKWEIADNFLYLIDLTYRRLNQDEGLEYVFPGVIGKIKASWYTGELKIPLGDQLLEPGCTRYSYNQIPYKSSWFIKIEKGEVINRWYKANY
jgi:hypothetical protein